MIKRLFKTIIGRRTFDLLKDKSDKRDYAASTPQSVVDKVSMRDLVFEVKNQGSAGSCFFFAFMTWYEIKINQINPKLLRDPIFKHGFSERYSYYWARKMMSTFPAFVGIGMRDGMKAIKTYGVTPDVLCPYGFTNLNEQPDFIADSFASFYGIESFSRVPDVATLKALILNKEPVIIGLRLGDSFMKYKGGILDVDSDKNKLGHAMTGIGYNSKDDSFEIVNSWGRSFGNDGCVFVSSKFIEQNLIDMWVAQIKRKRL